MKQTLSFHSPIIASTQSKVDVEAFEKSTDAFERRALTVFLSVAGLY